MQMGLLKVRRHLGQPGQVGRRGKRFKYSHGGRNKVGREAWQVDGGEVAYTVPACQGGTLHQAATAAKDGAGHLHVWSHSADGRKEFPPAVV